jgi:prepilin-type N-terminal cleavage/methylation domain-containing protein
MKLSSIAARPHRSCIGSRHGGFSTVELLITLAVILVLAAIASPMLVRTLRIYQLNSSATQLAEMLKLTRFEAIRKNTKADCVFQPSGTNWTVSTALANGTPGAQQTQVVLGGYANLLPAGSPVPDTTPIAGTLGGGGVLNPVSGAAGFIRFDARGAVDFQGGPLSVQVFYIGSADTSAGYRAVLVFPAGTTQIWRSAAAGDWQRTG